VVTLQSSQGNNPPNNSNQIPGAAGVTIQQIQLTNPGGNTVTLTSLTLSGATSAEVTSLSLLKNGVVITTTGFTGSTATFNFTDTIGPTGGTVTYQVVASFSNSAPTGSYQFNVTGGAGTNGQAVVFGNMPVPGADITIVAVTPTPSNSPTNSPTFTSTVTAVPATPTNTATPTPAGNKNVVIYPNPVTGTSVNVLPQAYSGVSNVEVEIFTTGFRKVQEETFPNVPPGVAVTLQLTDKRGTPLANGLYYLVVIVDGQRSIAKLLILR